MNIQFYAVCSRHFGFLWQMQVLSLVVFFSRCIKRTKVKRDRWSQFIQFCYLCISSAWSTSNNCFTKQRQFYKALVNVAKFLISRKLLRVCQRSSKIPMYCSIEEHPNIAAGFISCYRLSMFYCLVFLVSVFWERSSCSRQIAWLLAVFCL